MTGILEGWDSDIPPKREVQIMFAQQEDLVFRNFRFSGPTDPR